MSPPQNPSKTAPPAAREAPPAPPGPSSQLPPRLERAADSHDDGDAFDDFDLRDLADGPGRAGDLLSGLGIAGPDAPARDPLADLLNGVPTRNTTARDAPAPPADDEARPTPTPTPTPGILAELSEEFDRVARDPSQLGGRTVWQGLQATGDGQAPTLVQLQHKAQAYQLPHHMMLPSLGIDALIEEIGPSDGDTLFAPEERVDVLHLFAADLLRDLPRTPPIPSLTRVEHHATALDSHLRMGGVRMPPKESP